MKKTIREHLNDLPEPYRTEALENAHATDGSLDVSKDISLKDALQSAFIWSMSPQDDKYWRDFHSTL
jgi:hypothetical protein